MKLGLKPGKSGTKKQVRAAPRFQNLQEPLGRSKVGRSRIRKAVLAVLKARAAKSSGAAP